MSGIHVASLLFSVCVMLFADKQVLSWMRGKSETLNAKTVHLTHMLMWVGLGGLMVTGVIMLIPQWEYLKHEPLFLMKMLFVAVLVTNGVLLGRLAPIATERSFASLSLKDKIPLFVSGGISLTAWIGAFVLAKMLF